jgi:hypothetical protein
MCAELRLNEENGMADQGHNLMRIMCISEFYLAGSVNYVLDGYLLDLPESFTYFDC